MKWALLIVGGLCAAGALLYIAGLMMEKSHIASRTLRLNQPIDAVWQVLNDRAAFPSWRTDVAAIERVPDQDGKPVWLETYKDGSKLPMMVLLTQAPARIETKIADPTLPFGGTWTFELEPAGAGSRLRITERGEVYNPLFRVFSKLRDLRATMTAYQSNLARKFGEQPTFED